MEQVGTQKNAREMDEALRLAEGLARRFVRRHSLAWREREGDFIQDAQLAVLRAWERWRPEHGSRFVSYAGRAIERQLWRTSSTVREKLPTVSLDDAVGEDGETLLVDLLADERVDVEGEVVGETGNRELAAHLARLPQRERYVLRRIYVDGCTLEQVGRELKITRQAVNYVQHRALKKLRGGLTVARHQDPAGGL